MTPIVVTPVKNSLDTVKKTLKSVTNSSIPIDYYVFNDFSEQDTEDYLRSYADELNFNLVNLSDHVTTASPNYRTVLIMSQKMALEAGSALIIVESDVIVEPHTLQSLIQLQNQKQEAGMVAAVTTNQQGEINFPYSHISPTAPDIINTKRSLSFCCTLLSNQFLACFDFNELNEDKDWYDVHISKKSRTLGFDNFLVKSLPVIHLPHSSRPWKMEKYKNPLSYYFKKYFLKRDRI
ncbi:MAG: glycosyltransferase [Bacteroidetes bacterium]|nr:MAG: glycosyltransferase [Bacteroidota bacterium]